MIYLYAIVAASGQAQPDLPGLDGRPTRRVEAAGLAAVVSALPAPPPAAEPAILAHAALTEALMGAGPTLPVRFGTLLPDEAALQARLARHAATFRADLERLAGCVELGLRGLLAEEPQARPPVSPSGRDYMLSRLEQQRARAAGRALAEAVHDRLVPLARAAALGSAATGRMPLMAAYLLPAESVAGFRAAVAAAQAETPGLRLLCTGPWPPYSFVSPLA